MTERKSPCLNCPKPCESSLNEDGECLRPPTLAQLVTLGGEKVAELVAKMVEKKNESS